MTRTPLNGLCPRTLQEAARDPFDWWESASERHPSRALFDKRPGVVARLRRAFRALFLVR